MVDRISLIIPLRLTAGTYEGALRLGRICATVPRDLFDIVISDYGTEDAHAGPIRALEAEGIEVVRHPAPGKLFSIGRARDFGVQMARQKIVLFNDIDFFGTPDMYRRIHAEAMARDLARNMFDFFCVPVLFLTEEGTTDWFSAIDGGRPFVEPLDVASLEKAALQVQFTAFGSSAMVVNRHHYLALGGHDTRFSGHGAEDYDLLHRLASLAPKGPRPHEYFTDFKDNGVRNYWGFRSWFALYGLDVFARGIHLVHLWHPRRMEKGYFRSRPNFRHLKKLMRRFDRKAAMPLPLADPAGKGRWLVFCRSPADLALVRQLLARSRHYRLVKVSSIPTAARLADMARADRADALLVAPDVTGEIDRPASLTGLSVVRLRAGPAPDTSDLSIITPAGQASETTARTPCVRAAGGGVLYRYWQDADLGELGRFDTGVVPSPEPLTAPVFATFGGEAALDRKAHPRPRTRKKSSLWVKFKRRLTGY